MKKNKEFVRSVIILSVTGLILLMVVLFIVLQACLGENTKLNISTVIQEESTEQKIEPSEAFVVLIEEISDQYIMGYDINNNKIFSKVIDEIVKVNDSYGNVLPLSQIKVGDIVEVHYQSEKNKVVSIGKSSLTHSWNRISGVTIDTTEKQVNIAGSSYHYTDEILVVDCYGSKINISNIGAYDIVSLQAIEDTIWSITVEEASASLNLTGLPTSEGQIEIDYSRLIMFKDINEPIKLVPGKHKLVIKMQGYVTVVQEIVVEANEVCEIELKEAEIAYTTIKPNISSSNKDYKLEDCKIKVGDKVYNYGEEIKVQQDTYQVEVSATNHKKWRTSINLDKPIWAFHAVLTAIEEESKEIENLSGTTSAGTDSSDDSADKRTITINTSPTGANVYIDGELKGVTPYALEIENGTYEVLLEKVGYELYSSEIVLDTNNNQGSYLYQLKKKE